MATIGGNYIRTDADHHIVSWTPMTTAGSDVGRSVSISELPDKTVQVFGTFGTSGAVTIEGTNDLSEAVWGTLTDFQGNALVLTDSSVKLIAQNPLRIRPRISAGSGASLSVVLVASR